MSNPIHSPAPHAVLSALLIFGGVSTQAAAGTSPQPASPGAREIATGVRDGCPTFSWAGIPDATRYELVVYALRDERPHDAGSPALRVELPSSSSYTPALEDCLAAGRYAWAVRAIGPSGRSEWSEPLLFAVHDPASSPDLRRAAEEVLSQWLAERRISEGEATALRAAPLASPSVTSLQGAALETPTVEVSFTPVPCQWESFADVPASSPYCSWIELLYEDGIAVGCGTGPMRNYCPLDAVTRQQMAVFLGKTLQLVGRARSPRQLEAGAQHNCAVLASGRLACWGDDGSGQSTAPAGTFASVSAGRFHSCGLKSDGTVACWGYNGAGQSTAPGGTFASVSAGGIHSCGVRWDWTVTCWGYDGNGESTPPAGAFMSVSAGDAHTCGIEMDGTVACWGRTEDGQSTPPGGTFASVSAGAVHTCGLRGDGTVACWGDNTFGQTSPPGMFASISAGGWHTCGLRGDGTVACWGNNTYGQSRPPAGTFTSVSSGGLHSCGVRGDGTVACWGYDGSGQANPPGWL